AVLGITSLYLSSSLFNVVVDEYPQVLDGLRELVVPGHRVRLFALVGGRCRRRSPDGPRRPPPRPSGR
ncbi:hypothetical protein, partial [Streptomyces sp. NPDC001274]